MRRAEPQPAPPPVRRSKSPLARVNAKHPNHLWHVDLTVAPTSAGFWTSWMPLALPQCWPFCWWLAVVIDHYSRRALGYAVYWRQPTSEQVRRFLGGVIGRVGSAPKHLVSDSGTQFTCADFQSWCSKKQIRQRFGAVGKRGSIAVIERFIRTLKDEGVRVLPVVPLALRAFQRELSWFFSWYNSSRPHMTLKGATPDEVYFARRSACRAPRFETRAAWPRGSPCALPQVLVKGKPGATLDFAVDFVGGRRHLPTVTIRRAA
jgi:putative transposase